MRPAAIFLILFTTLSLAKAQDSPALSVECPAQGRTVTTDPNGNVYVTNGATLFKLNADGEILFRYTNFQQGNISSIDVDNPLKIMVFYKEASLILFLDEKLVPMMEPLDLFSRFHNIALATYSTDNTIWLYDEVLQDLINVNFQLDEISRNHLSWEDFHPLRFYSLQEKQLAMCTEESIYYFDAFGTYLKQLPFPHVVTVYNSAIDYASSIGSDHSMTLTRYDTRRMSSSTLGSCGPVLNGSCDAITIYKNRIFFIDNKFQLNYVIIP